MSIYVTPIPIIPLFNTISLGYYFPPRINQFCHSSGAYYHPCLEVSRMVLSS